MGKIAVIKGSDGKHAYDIKEYGKQNCKDTVSRPDDAYTNNVEYEKGQGTNPVDPFFSRITP